jgi:hypothetical protein
MFEPSSLMALLSMGERANEPEESFTLEYVDKPFNMMPPSDDESLFRERHKHHVFSELL